MLIEFRLEFQQSQGCSAASVRLCQIESRQPRYRIFPMPLRAKRNHDILQSSAQLGSSKPQDQTASELNRLNSQKQGDRLGKGTGLSICCDCIFESADLEELRAMLGLY